jgi:hypothetical protein
MAAGPASAIARPEPTKRPAPITPAMDNMVTCRDFNPWLRLFLLSFCMVSPF